MKESAKFSGIAIAAAAASLLIAGCASQGGATSTSADASTVKVKCYGANACKGQNACKSKGFITLTERACIERLGRG